ncbi:LuxR C-terminal-related transcriptional regulator [Kribbella sp. NPDC051770]|uniref:ATP-binding protein n=1 Tax=Kribbella sp. NPDC051770 TaxID=3155413 RepID=UPI0034266C4F
MNRINLGPLPAAAMVDFVAGALDARPDDALLALADGTGGNPGLLATLLDGLRQEEAVAVGDGTARLLSARLPRQVEETIAVWLDEVSGPALTLLEVAAFLGAFFTRDELAVQLGCRPEDLVPAIDENVGAGLLTVGRDVTLTFQHDLVRQHITRGVPEAVSTPLRRQAMDNGWGPVGPAPAASRSFSGTVRASRHDDRWARLTDSERTVADLVAHGLSNRQAAERMFLSPHTVSFHLRKVYRKLGITSRVELTRLATEHERGGSPTPGPPSAPSPSRPPGQKGQMSPTMTSTGIDTSTSSPSSTSLRGRQSELRGLRQLITATTAGRSSVGLIEGGAGLGKSELLGAAARMAGGAGMDVAAGRTDESNCLLPLAPLRDAMSRSRQSHGGDPTFETAGRPSRDPERLSEELTVALQDSARRNPVLVSLDDLHRADPLTLLGIQEVVQRMNDSPVMWLLTRRPTPSTPVLRSMFSALAAEGATSFDLEPLTAGAVRDLVEDLLGRAPDDALLAVLAKCSGNPYLVTELLRSMADRDDLVIDTTDARFLPSGTSGHLYQRFSTGLTAVCPLTREFIEVASTFGMSFDVSCVAEVLRRTVAQLLPAVHEALETEWLVEKGDRLGFRHAVVREAVYAAIPVSARALLHREAAAALLTTGGDAAEVVAHLITGAEEDTANPVQAIVHAASRVAAGRPGTAADLLLRAVELMPSDAPDRPHRTLDTLEALVRAGRAQEAVVLGETALRAAHPIDLEVRLRSQVAEALGVDGRSGEALRQARIALDLPIADTATRAHLLVVEATAQLFEGNPGTALRAASEAHSAAGATASAEAMTRAATAKRQALASMGAAERMLGRLEASLELIDRFVLSASSSPAGPQELEPLWSRGRTLIALDRLDEASAALAAVTHQVEQYGRTTSAVSGHACRAALNLYQGALDEAITEGGIGLRAADSLGSEVEVTKLSAILAEATAFSGQFEAARGHLRRGLALAGRGDPFARAALAWASTTTAEGSGDGSGHVLDLARDLYETSPGRIELLAMNPMVGPRLVSIALRAGDRRRAAVATDLVEYLSETNPGVTSLAAAALQAKGLLDGDTDRLVAASESFRASARPLTRALAAEDAARALRRNEYLPEATAQLTLAVADYDRAGALPHAQRVRAELEATRKPGGHIASRPSSGWNALTAAELRVVRMVADGLTNRMIADELSLSPHTVESHLRHSFHKLDIRSRVELTRIVVEHEPITDT